MTNTKKDWFDTHVEVMTFNNDKVKEKRIKESLKNKLTSQLTEEPYISYKKAINNLKLKVRFK